jgi:hypothetical protein
VALQQWAERDFDGAAAWLGTTDERSRNRFSPAFVEAWAQKDPGSALTWCQENLTDSSLVQAVGGALRGAATKDIVAAAALVTAMDPSPARTEAAVTVAHKWFPGLSAGNPVNPEAIAWLSSLDPDSLKRVMDDVNWGWASSDPKSMAAFLATADPEKIPGGSYSLLARLMVQQSPLETMNWASHLSDTVGLSAGAAGFAEWRTSQPDAATQWLNALPAGDPRRQPYFQKAIQNLVYHPQAPEQLAAMTEADRAIARNVIEGMGLPADRRTALLNALGKN